MFKSFLDIAGDISPLNSEWERVAKSLPALIESGNIRNSVLCLPEFKLDGLSKGELKRVYTIVTFIAHAYVRGGSMDQVINVNFTRFKSLKILGSSGKCVFSLDGSR